MTRSSLRLWASLGVVFLLIACAKAEGGEAGSGDGDGDGDGDNGNSSSGGVITSSSGGMLIGATGGVPSSSSGGAPLGGASSGGASSGGLLNMGGAPDGTGGAGTGGEALTGDCAGVGGRSSITAQGDRAVIECPLKQGACPEEAVNVPALFECIDSHLGNCLSQGPDGGSAWFYIGLCSELGMGGATN